MAESKRPIWGIQFFSGASFFDEPAQFRLFAQAVARIRQPRVG
jgi:hypothetical protein